MPGKVRSIGDMLDSWFLDHFMCLANNIMVLNEQYWDGLISEQEWQRLYIAIRESHFKWEYQMAERISSLGDKYPLGVYVSSWYKLRPAWI